MDNILTWINPFNWVEGTLVEFKWFNTTDTICISTYGKVTVSGVYVGMLKPPVIYKLIDQYGLHSYEGDYREDTQQDCMQVKLWTPVHGSWEFITDEQGPSDLIRFSKDIHHMVNQLVTT